MASESQISKTFAEENAKHFNKVSIPHGDWPQWIVDLHTQITDFLTSTECHEWLGISDDNRSLAKDGSMLDYAAGHGLVTEALVQDYATAIGVDISEAMVEQYHATAARLGLGPERMKAICGDFLADLPAPPTQSSSEQDHELHDFDLVACSMALHHFEDPSVAVGRLVDRLKQGGRILIISWTPIDGSTRAQMEYQEELKALSREDREEAEELLRSHQARHTISRPDGFTQQEMREWLECAGCKDVRWWLAEEMTPIPAVKKKSQVFCAIATKE